MEDYKIIKSDFNEIAELDDPKWNHNNCYFNQLMKLIPEEHLVGHAVLSKTREEGTYALNFLYIVPELRSKGLGAKMVGELERYAMDNFNTKKLMLLVHTYNPRARRCYEKCGFVEVSRNDTLIRMVKNLE